MSEYQAAKIATVPDAWEPTTVLRLVQSARDDASPPKLQQLWRQLHTSPQWGHVVGQDTEWRDVEIVYE